MIQSRRMTYLPIVLVLILLATAAGIYYCQRPAGNPDALWEIVSRQYVPNQQRHGQAAPCREVNLAAGYVVLKDLNGPLQFLLIPVEKITGIESPRLLDTGMANFFADAWRSRRYLAEKRGAPIPDSALSLTINSRSGRTQNQLHIHISCLRPDVRAQLDRASPAIGADWQPLAAPIMGHAYLAKRISAAELAQRSPFLTLAHGIPDGATRMDRFGLGLAQLSDGAYVLLASERNLLRRNVASVEEIQDHACAILR